MAPNLALNLAEEIAQTPLPSLAQMPLADVLRLIRSPNVGPITFFHLIRRFGNAAEAQERMPELARRGGNKAPTAPFSREQAEAEITAVEKFGAKLVVYGAAEYPALLLHIPDPPPVIALRGNAATWAKPCIGIVGARNASAGGCSLAQNLARELGAAGMGVVSGLARGIDSFAHKGSLETGTVAVIAGGIDNVYPPENARLFAQIAERGAIISEQPFGATPFAGSFPGRNRIIAGMSKGIIVVEAAKKSGSLITARFALEQGREVYAVPGSPMDPRSAGPNALIKQGAHLVESAADVLDALPKTQNRLMEETRDAFLAAPAAEASDAEMAKAQEAVLEKLGVTPVSVDELLAQCGIGSGLLFTVLMELELAGRVLRVSGNKVGLRV